MTSVAATDCRRRRMARWSGESGEQPWSILSRARQQSVPHLTLARSEGIGLEAKGPQTRADGPVVISHDSAVCPGQRWWELACTPCPGMLGTPSCGVDRSDQRSRAPTPSARSGSSGSSRVMPASLCTSAQSRAASALVCTGSAESHRDHLGAVGGQLQTARRRPRPSGWRTGRRAGTVPATCARRTASTTSSNPCRASSWRPSAAPKRSSRSLRTAPLPIGQ